MMVVDVEQKSIACRDVDNLPLELAERYINGTDVSIFLTGKAGTGKTTFLQRLVQHTNKRCVVVAPTGVAAVNAGGVTIHSFFQLPFGPYLPDVPELLTEYQLPDRHKQLRKSKQQIVRTLDLLIIDEISMVRADLLDAVDDTLRRYRRNDKPFGGVQLLMIGDVQQLPPVVKDDEAPYLYRVYKSPFFFESKALQRLHYLTIQLTKIYRQQDADFIALLNQVREGHFDDRAMQLLNSRLQPGFEAPQGSDYIRLTSHNSQAEEYNKKKMDALPGKEHLFTATVEGNFPVGSMPTEPELRLKEGAQVMFVKNDSSGMHRYYNGKIGTVLRIDGEESLVVQLDNGEQVDVSPDRWENMRYEIDPDDNTIKPQLDGSFVQMPLKPAWAVTIHKAQGLTFDHVIIDAQDAFAYGQVYVALSRCRTLQGLVLSSPITQRNVFESSDIDRFNSTLPTEEQVQDLLPACENNYYFDRLDELFSFDKVREATGHVSRLFRNHLQTLYPTQCHTVETLLQSDLPQMLAVADKFRRQLQRLRQCATPVADSYLQERVSKGVAYFFEQMADLEQELQTLLQVEVDSKMVRAEQQKATERMHDQVSLKRFVLEQLRLHGFSVEHYNKAHVDFLLEKKEEERAGESRRRKAAPQVTLSAEQVYGDVRHPLLVKMLTAWRKEKYTEAGVASYQILPQKTVLAIANLLPTTRAALQSVYGMGKMKMQRYGEELLQLVAAYCREQGIGEAETGRLEFAVEKEELPKRKEKRTEKKEPTLPIWLETARLFAGGATIEELVHRLHRSSSTIEGHLIEALKNGSLEIEQLLTTEEQDELVNYILDHGPFDKLKPIFDHFEARYSYYKIRAALLFAATLQ